MPQPNGAPSFRLRWSRQYQSRFRRAVSVALQCSLRLFHSARLYPPVLSWHGHSRCPWNCQLEASERLYSQASQQDGGLSTPETCAVRLRIGCAQIYPSYF
ncbi:hypothetical protein BJX66DRAFT_293774 [Aspergillus keveii]|uniref:Uncharacterized protein n=1 Tax=Aspergillus keveii TaxID=714993 RepID=A0ABR4GKK2_9EURO